MISSAYLQIVMMARGSWLVGLVISISMRYDSISTRYDSISMRYDSISMRYDFISTRYAAIYPLPGPSPVGRGIYRALYSVNIYPIAHVPKKQ
jgi:hypothetical protein